jgi:hypothetical protein
MYRNLNSLGYNLKATFRFRYNLLFSFEIH